MYGVAEPAALALINAGLSLEELGPAISIYVSARFAGGLSGAPVARKSLARNRHRKPRRDCERARHVQWHLHAVFNAVFAQREQLYRLDRVFKLKRRQRPTVTSRLYRCPCDNVARCG